MNVTGPRDYFRSLQARIVAELEALDGQPFRRDEWTRPEGGGGIARVMEEGNLFERGGVNFSHVSGARLPPSATAARPELANRAWEAMGVSLVLHPRNPYVPTVHMNVRVFVAHSPDGRADEDRWWFGERPGHADIIVACVLRFVREAHPDVFDDTVWPALAAHADACEALPTFQAVVQPFSVSPPKG